MVRCLKLERQSAARFRFCAWQRALAEARLRLLLCSVGAGLCAAQASSLLAARAPRTAGNAIPAAHARDPLDTQDGREGGRGRRGGALVGRTDRADLASREVAGPSSQEARGRGIGALRLGS